MSENALEAIRNKLKSRYGAKDGVSLVEPVSVPAEDLADEVEEDDLTSSLVEDLDEDYTEDEETEIDEDEDLAEEQSETLKTEPLGATQYRGMSRPQDQADNQVDDDEEQHIAHNENAEKDKRDKVDYFHDNDVMVDTSAKLAGLLKQLYTVVERLESKELGSLDSVAVNMDRSDGLGGTTLESATLSILRREIRIWLEGRLPDMVRDIVDSEIQRLLPRKYKR